MKELIEEVTFLMSTKFIREKLLKKINKNAVNSVIYEICSRRTINAVHIISCLHESGDTIVIKNRWKFKRISAKSVIVIDFRTRNTAFINHLPNLTQASIRMWPETGEEWEEENILLREYETKKAILPH